MKTKTQIITTNYDHNADDDIDHRSIVTNTFDYRGNQLSSVMESDSNLDDLIDGRTTFTYTYDWRGNLLTSLTETDYGADGTIDSLYAITNTYNSAGNQLTGLSESDYDADGTIDSRQESFYEYPNGGELSLGVVNLQLADFVDGWINFAPISLPNDPLHEGLGWTFVDTLID